MRDEPFFEIYHDSILDHGSEYIAFFNGDRNRIVYLYEPCRAKAEEIEPRRYSVPIKKDDMDEHAAMIEALDMESMKDGPKVTSPSTWLQRSLNGSTETGSPSPNGYDTDRQRVNTLIRNAKREFGMVQ